MTERSFTLGTLAPDSPRPVWERIWIDELARTGCQVAPSRLAADLARREAAAARTSDGWAFGAVNRMAHPLTRVAETSLTRFAATADSAAKLLLTELDHRGLLDRCSTEVDVPADSRHTALSGHGFSERVLIVRHDTSATLAAPNPALDIHPVGPDEAGFVVECLVTALGRGLAKNEPAVDLAAWARTRYPLHDKATVCLVGSLDGRAVCHGLGYRRADRHGRARVLYLVDVFVVAEYQGRGLSQAMSAAMMGHAREAGYEVIESDVVLAPGSERLRDGLRRAGWTEDRVRWSRG